ncbi:AGE family epimerase/isomerase [Salinimicrobium sp. MT39]|uniref:Cellobiose 2-epimerase n=1 Tax=Salinimicrobium profundisediminis TaxID=2994553 RepID=A0A9X3CU44_9FLAO|nr:AGE family epimerase/isomerase [Salinimicrobium profundisediminis]MCX2836605.1 AGE family epimerase/isomerase [Salinimicrobium profundisediminis]
MTNSTSQLKAELSAELENILMYWKEFSIDEKNGGFVGQRDHWNKEVVGASKGVILNTRILWTFSAVANQKGEKFGDLRSLADRAYGYLKKAFRDDIFEGVYWELDALGKPLNKRKQIYAQAFAIYALSEYYILSGAEDAKNWAVELFELVEQHARKKEFNGYLEAFQENWSPIEDMRLSEKDKNSAKTMNTHLHVLEAYTTLYKITKSEAVKEALDNLIELFLQKFYDPKNQHFQLFFDNQWNREGNVISYGHDIEAIWLMIEAAKASGNEDLIKRTQDIAVPVAETFLKEAHVQKQGVINEKDLDSGKTDLDRHWWPHAEAMVGLEYAYQISGEEKFKDAIFDIWTFTQKHIIDHQNGEWFFRIDKNLQPYTQEDKLGMWKCPYHNSRACLILTK